MGTDHRQSVLHRFSFRQARAQWSFVDVGAAIPTLAASVLGVVRLSLYRCPTAAVPGRLSSATWFGRLLTVIADVSPDPISIWREAYAVAHYPHNRTLQIFASRMREPYCQLHENPGKP